MVVFVQEKGNLWPIMLYLKFLLVILVNDLQCCNFPYLVPPIFNSTVSQIALFSECPLLTDSNVRDVIQLISISKSALSQQFSIYTVNKIRGKKTHRKWWTSVKPEWCRLDRKNSWQRILPPWNVLYREVMQSVWDWSL